MEFTEFSIHKADLIQNELKSKITFCEFDKENIRYIAGIDLAYWNKQDEEFAVCCIVVIDAKTKEIVEQKYSFGVIKVPYVAGYLAFRELPLVLKTAEKLEIKPDLYMFDGNGYLHPKHMGIATHASFYLKKPTIGVAKSYYKIDRTDYVLPENEKGSYTDIIIKGDVYGRVLRTLKNVKPVFVSVGNYIDLQTATEITIDFVNKESHIPIPVRIADLETHKMRDKLK